MTILVLCAIVDSMETKTIRRKPEVREQTINFRLPKTLYAVIRERALREHRTIGSETLYLIERGLEAVAEARR